jgi:hypothetical protein
MKMFDKEEILKLIKELSDEQVKIMKDIHSRHPKDLIQPIPESDAKAALVDKGLLDRITRPVANMKDTVAIAGHMLTDKGLCVLNALSRED